MYFLSFQHYWNFNSTQIIFIPRGCLAVVTDMRDRWPCHLPRKHDQVNTLTAKSSTAVTAGVSDSDPRDYVRWWV
jgi:hypothetical protein